MSQGRKHTKKPMIFKTNRENMWEAIWTMRKQLIWTQFCWTTNISLIMLSKKQDKFDHMNAIKKFKIKEDHQSLPKHPQTIRKANRIVSNKKQFYYKKVN